MRFTSYTHRRSFRYYKVHNDAPNHNPISWSFQFVVQNMRSLCVCVSFVAHFVHSIFSFFIVVNQFYDAEIIKEYVIRGNAAVLKCSIPSFVADFVYVSEWIDEEGTIYKHSDSYGVYHTHNLVHWFLFEIYIFTVFTVKSMKILKVFRFYQSWKWYITCYSSE